MAGEVKKKLRPGAIELHPTECALVVLYEVQEVFVHDDGSKTIQSSSQATKKIPVKNLSERVDLNETAQEIVEKCKLIHPGKVNLVEELLQQLLHRECSAGRGRRHEDERKPSSRPSSARRSGLDAEERAEVQRRSEAAQASLFKSQQKQYEPAVLDRLDDYIEELYEEDMARKLKATGMIAMLFRNTQNFEVLLSHPNLLQTLARVIQEDGKRSIDLCINILSVFFSLSNFSQFHPLILENKIGAMTMDIIDLETKRTEHRATEEGISPSLVAQKAMEASLGQVSLTQREKKILALIQKQDRLLYICFYLLLNLAEDVGIEKKMRKKNIVVYLVKMLDRANVELLILATTFLKKLSIYKENKDLMNNCNIVPKLVKFVPVKNEVLLMAVLRLLHNLSFDSNLREIMVKEGLIPKAVELMGTGRFQPVVLGLLYHLSIDDKCKSMFSYTDAVSRLYDMMMRVQDLRNTPELIALVVNLTQNSRNAEVMCDGERFDVLVRRAFQTCDELAFKVVRNLSQVEARNVKQKFGPYIERMVLLLQAPGIPAELFVEVLGTLANCYIPEFDFLELVRKHSLLQFIASYCQPREVDDDILLEVIMFVGILCNDGTAPLLVASGLVNTLFNLMGDKKEDDEFVLQIAFTFQKFLLQGPTRDALLHNTEVVLYLVDLLQDKNKEVRKVADACLDIIMDSSEELAVNIRNLKFEAYNQEWLEAVGHNPNKHMLSVAMPVRPAMTNGKVIMADEGEVEYGTMSDVLGAYKLGDTHLSDFEDLGETQRLWTGGRDDIGIGLDSPGHFGIDYDEDEFRRNYECY